MAKAKIITKRLPGIPRKWQRVQSTLDKKRARTLAVEKAGRETPRKAPLPQETKGERRVRLDKRRVRQLSLRPSWGI